MFIETLDVQYARKGHAWTWDGESGLYLNGKSGRPRSAFGHSWCIRHAGRHLVPGLRLYTGLLDKTGQAQALRRLTGFWPSTKNHGFCIAVVFAR
jgi:hypothetical protein